MDVITTQSRGNQFVEVDRPYYRELTEINQVFDKANRKRLNNNNFLPKDAKMSPIFCYNKKMV